MFVGDACMLGICAKSGYARMGSLPSGAILCANTVQANETFAAGKLEEAEAQYSAALRYVDENLLMQVESPFLEFAHGARAPTLLNLAACHLKREDWAAAEGTASEALSSAVGGGEQTKDLRCKALFRRGQARRSMLQSEEAQKDLTAALQLCVPCTIVTAYDGTLQ
jgi:tetratricopeptide (TPR) repeat protein